MTERFLGSIITSTPVEPSANVENSSASGVWNIHDPLIFGQAEDWPDPTVASPDKFVENLFSCFAYTGTGSNLDIDNGIDILNKGGLTWFKRRDATSDHQLFDTERTGRYRLESNTTDVQADEGGVVWTPLSDGGFRVNGDGGANIYNSSGHSYISWTFRKQPKFFDVVTYSGDGLVQDKTISHNLGATPGMVVVKRTDTNGYNWYVCHRSLGLTSKYLNWDNANAQANGPIVSAADASTVSFSRNSGFNNSGQDFVVYLFAHNDGDGGFGSTGDQDIIKCGSYTGDGSSSNAITLGFEPQWIMIKNATASANWILFDNVRGIHTGADDNYMFVDTTAAGADGELIEVTADGFRLTANNSTTNNSSQTYIYIAIRRGPMKAPTAGTQVFFPDLITANQSGITATGIGFSPDVIINLVRSNANYGQQICSRITGPKKQLFTNYFSAEATTNGTALVSFDMDGYTLGSDSAGTGWNAYSGYTSVKHCFKRAPGFLDVVAYAGTGSATTVSHNLGVTPELILIKGRNVTAEWVVFSRNDATDHLHLNAGDATADEDRFFNDTAPTSSVFTVGDRAEVNGSYNYIAFLFATVAGVSKVGTYSGTGNDINVDCGFTSGARFILIKRTDSSGDWYVWDSARGIVDGNDPYMLYGPGAAVEVTNTDYIDPLSSGFTITSGAPSDLNTNGGTYLFLAIA